MVFHEIELILIGIFIVLVVIALRGRGGGYRRPKGLFTSRCPNCREIIRDSCKVCPVCHRDTGWHGSEHWWEKIPETPIDLLKRKKGRE